MARTEVGTQTQALGRLPQQQGGAQGRALAHVQPAKSMRRFGRSRRGTGGRYAGAQIGKIPVERHAPPSQRFEQYRIKRRAVHGGAVQKGVLHPQITAVTLAARERFGLRHQFVQVFMPDPRRVPQRVAQGRHHAIHGAEGPRHTTEYRS